MFDVGQALNGPVRDKAATTLELVRLSISGYNLGHCLDPLVRAPRKFTKNPVSTLRSQLRGVRSECNSSIQAKIAGILSWRTAPG